MVLTPEAIRDRDSPIVLAEVLRAIPKTLPPRKEGAPEQKGFAITLKIHEVLRGNLEAEKIEIPFSAAGYARVWEFKAKPEPGMNVLAYLASGEGNKWHDYGVAGSVVPLNGLDDPEVKTIRKILHFWAIPDSEKQQESLRSGCSDDEPGFRNYCLGVLMKNARQNKGEAKEVRSFLWELFNDSRTPVETVMRCDNFFWNTYRALGWNSTEPRYHILTAAAERYLTEGESARYNSFNHLLTALCRYPQHREETLALLLRTLRSDRDTSKTAAASRIGWLFEQVPATHLEEEFNIKVLTELHRLIASEDDSVAQGAAYGLVHIRDMASVRGLHSDQLQPVLEREAERTNHDHVKRLLNGALRKAAKSESSISDDDRQKLVGSNWQTLVGKKITVVGKATYEKTAEFGVAAEVDGRLLWLPDISSWPGRRPPKEPVLLSGTLTQVFDKAVFRYVEGQPFGEGLPTPEPFSLRNASRRFVLVDSKREILSK